MRRTGIVGTLVVSSMLQAGACGGGGSDPENDAGERDATVNTPEDGGGSDAGNGADGGGSDGSVAGSEPVLRGVVTAGLVPIASGEAITISLSGSDFGASCVVHLDVGSRSTVLTTTTTSETMIAAQVPAAATENLRGYGTIRLSGCPGDAAPFPIHVATPTTTSWTGPSITGLSPSTGGSGTSVSIGGTYNVSLAIDRAPAATIPTSGNAFVVPADLASGPLRFTHGGSSQTFVGPPFYVQANLAASAMLSASSSYTGYPTSRMVDENVLSAWFPADGNCSAAACTSRDVWVRADWATAQSIAKVGFRESSSEGAMYGLIRVAVETFASPPGPNEIPGFTREFLFPIGSDHADFTFTPPLTNVRVLRIRVLEDDSETRGSPYTGSIGELLVLAP